LDYNKLRKGENEEIGHSGSSRELFKVQKFINRSTPLDHAMPQQKLKESPAETKNIFLITIDPHVMV